MTEEEMVGWHHQLGGHESAQALGEGGGQGGLVSYSRWGHRESDTWFSSGHLLSHVRLCDPMDCSTPGFPLHLLPELVQTQCPLSQ